MAEEGKDMAGIEKETGQKGGEAQQPEVIKPWGDTAFHGPDIKPEEGRRLFGKDPDMKKRKNVKGRAPLSEDHPLEKRRGTIAEYVNHRQD